MRNKIILCLITIITLICCNFYVEAADFEKCYVNVSALNCRTKPSMSGDVITTFSAGKELSIIGAEGAWWQVYDGVIQGWCYSQYLKVNYNEQPQTQDSTYLGNFKISYYTCSPSENGGSNLTAKGQRLSDVVGVAIAADPRVIPYYSKVYIEGIGVRTVLDCGGAIKGNKIDVLVRNNSDIPACGVHYSNVYLLN